MNVVQLPPHVSMFWTVYVHVCPYWRPDVCTCGPGFGTMARAGSANGAPTTLIPNTVIREALFHQDLVSR